MNRLLKEVTVKRPSYPVIPPLQEYAKTFVKDLQSRQAPQDSVKTHSLQIHLQFLDTTAESMQIKSVPLHIGTIYSSYYRLVFWVRFEHYDLCK